MSRFGRRPWLRGVGIFQSSVCWFSCGARGCPMDKYTRFALEGAEDVPMALALMVFVSLWSVVATAVTIYCSTLGHQI